MHTPSHPNCVVHQGKGLIHKLRVPIKVLNNKFYAATHKTKTCQPIAYHIIKQLFIPGLHRPVKNEWICSSILHCRRLLKLKIIRKLRTLNTHGKCESIYIRVSEWCYCMLFYTRCRWYFQLRWVVHSALHIIYLDLKKATSNHVHFIRDNNSFLIQNPHIYYGDKDIALQLLKLSYFTI